MEEASNQKSPSLSHKGSATCRSKSFNKIFWWTRLTFSHLMLYSSSLNDVFFSDLNLWRSFLLKRTNRTAQQINWHAACCIRIKKSDACDLKWNCVFSSVDFEYSYRIIIPPCLFSLYTNSSNLVFVCLVFKAVFYRLYFTAKLPIPNQNKNLRTWNHEILIFRRY